MPLMVPVKLRKAGADWPRNGKAQTHRVADFLLAGVKPAVALPPDLPAGLVELTLSAEPQEFEYWLGLPNFYSVMSYNPRVYYAMAVSQLAEALQRAP